MCYFKYIVLNTIPIAAAIRLHIKSSFEKKKAIIIHVYIYIPCILQHSYYVIYYGASIYHIMYLNKNYDLEFVVSFILSLEIHDCISYSIKFMCFVFEITLKGFLK